MKKLLLTALFVGAFFCAQAQNQQVEKGLLRLNAIAPGISYELGVGKKSTLNFEAILVPYIEKYGTEVAWKIFPALGAEYRYFTNLGRRVGKGKNTLGNSGNYVSFLNQVLITAPIAGNIEFDVPFAYQGGFVYGLQRSYGKSFYFGAAVGPVIFTRDNDPTALLYLDVRIGWVILKRN